MRAKAATTPILTPEAWRNPFPGTSPEECIVVHKYTEGETGKGFDPTITSNGGGNTADIAVSENTMAVTTIRATDQNINQTLSYSIAGGEDGALFKIDSGVLSFISAPDFEHPRDVNHDGFYEVLVGASDGDLGLIAQLIRVQVTDVNESPVILSGGGGDTANYTVTEVAFEHGRRNLTTIHATDPDRADLLAYSIVAGTGLDKKGHSLFSIDKTTGLLSFLEHPKTTRPIPSPSKFPTIVV